VKILTPDEMREVDRRTIELGIPGIVLMENAGHRVVELLERRFSPLGSQRIVIFCGKGNNGGDGLVVARQLLTRIHPVRLDVVLAADPDEFQGDAAANYRMFQVAGGSVTHDIPVAARVATLVIDALLGTGIKGPATGRCAELIHEINLGFPAAKIVAVDIPSGLPHTPSVRAHHTVTFVAPKIDQVQWPQYEACGELVVGEIGAPAHLLDSVRLSLAEPREFSDLFRPRTRNSNKGLYGHALVVAGGRGKTGAAAMSGIAALRAGAGLVTVASAESAISEIATFAPELMTAPLDETGSGAIASGAFNEIRKLAEKKTVLAVGPGVGTHRLTVGLVRRLFAEIELPMVVDADGLNALAGSNFRVRSALRVLTPHPGEMSRLCGLGTAEVQQDRLGIARRFAAERNVIVVLKGDRTVTALPDARAWINPTGSPAMATGGTGDILTGLITGLLAQFPDRPEQAVVAAVWLHGRAGELGAAELGEKPFLATDILRYLPEAMRAAGGHE
jgi:ADP-dependent NAD(P)H-hydrate dehydratase / NAD(P)H-hydrate epimerase